MLRNNQSSWALGLGMIAWICLLFSPLAFVQGVQADEVAEYGTVIGIVSRHLPTLLAPAPAPVPAGYDDIKDQVPSS